MSPDRPEEDRPTSDDQQSADGDAGGPLSDAIASLRAALSAGPLSKQEVDDIVKEVAANTDTLRRLTSALSGDLPGPVGRIVLDPPIFEAIEESDVDAVKAALEDWDVNRRHGDFNKTALYAATSNICGVSLPVIEVLLDAGADPRLGLTDGNVLHGLGFGRFDGVSAQELARIVERCVALGADLEERTNHLQWTPLHTAINEWEETAVEALLIAGADPNARAGDDNAACTAGQSCLEMAIGMPGVSAPLLEHGADPYATNSAGRSVVAELDRLMATSRDGDFRRSVAECRSLIGPNHRRQ